jgi:hypothetical protein
MSTGLDAAAGTGSIARMPPAARERNVSSGNENENVEPTAFGHHG